MSNYVEDGKLSIYICSFLLPLVRSWSPVYIMRILLGSVLVALVTWFIYLVPSLCISFSISCLLVHIVLFPKVLFLSLSSLFVSVMLTS